MNKNHHNEGTGLGKTVVGLGAAAALIGAYLLYGSKKGPERREKVRGWMFKMKGEVLEEIENLKEVSEDAYYKVIDEVKTKYAQMQNVTADEVEEMAQELKDGWNDIVDATDEMKGKVKSKVKEKVTEVMEKPKRGRKK